MPEQYESQATSSRKALDKVCRLPSVVATKEAVTGPGGKTRNIQRAASAWVADIWLERQVSIERNRFAFKIGNRRYVYSHDEFMTHLMVEQDQGGGGFRKSQIEEVVVRIRREERDDHIKLLTIKLAFTGANDEIRSLVRAITGRDDRIAQKVIEHFIWQVKRKMHHLTVDDHMMPIFTGSQGGGKSRMVEQLCRPLDGFLKSISLSDTKDSRWFRMFEENFILVADELQGATHADVEALKRLITGEYVAARGMGSNVVGDACVRTTLIGTSNKDVGEMIQDFTGNRRFYQIDCLEKFDFDAINRIDWVKVWQGVDENAVAPIKCALAEVREIQLTQKTLSPEEEFLDDEDIRPSDNRRFFVSIRKLYDSYCRYLNSRNIKKLMSKKRFSKQMRGLGLESHAKRDDRGFIVGKNIEGHPDGETGL